MLTLSCLPCKKLRFPGDVADGTGLAWGRRSRDTAAQRKDPVLRRTHRSCCRPVPAAVRGMARFWRRGAAAGAMACVMASVALSAVAAVPGPAAMRDNPRLALPAGHLDCPPEEPPFVCVHGAFGSPFSAGQGHFGYGGSVIFLPPAASGFLDRLHAWNTGLVLQLDKQRLGNGDDIRSCDLVFRRYFAERRGGATRAQPFAGAGVGVSSVTASSGDLAGLANDWSWVLEAGQEWRTGRRLLLVKAQLRLLDIGGHDLSSWSLLAGYGLPFPW